MSNCHEMKKGEIYTCEDCGIELEVVKACKDVDKPAETCNCETNEFTCCGSGLVKKEQQDYTTRTYG